MSLGPGIATADDFSAPDRKSHEHVASTDSNLPTFARRSGEVDQCGDSLNKPRL